MSTSTTDRVSIPARPIPFPRLVLIELRKSIDTRAGTTLLVLALAVSAAIPLVQKVRSGFAAAFGVAELGVTTLLPILAVLAMTTEWTQRTALVTFVLTPRRGRVVNAKIAAVLALAVAALLVVGAGVAATIVVVGGSWDGAAGALGGAMVTTVCGVLLGAGIGASLHQTAPALVAYIALPALWTLGAPALLGDGARWFDYYSAVGALATGELDGAVAPTVVTLTVWLGLSLAIGIVRTLRREVS